MRIWTEAYTPFIMGGDCNAPIICEVPVHGPFDFGKGFQGFLAVSPHGRVVVVEAETGGVVGSSVTAVRLDVEAADSVVMEVQIADAKKRVLKVRTVSPEEFWGRLKRKSA